MHEIRDAINSFEQEPVYQEQYRAPEVTSRPAMTAMTARTPAAPPVVKQSKTIYWLAAIAIFFFCGKHNIWDNVADACGMAVFPGPMTT